MPVENTQDKMTNIITEPEQVDIDLNPTKWDAFLIALQDYKIAAIEIYYCGVGDSGAIEHITGLTEEQIEYTEDIPTNSNYNWSDNKPANFCDNINEFIENFAYPILNNIEDWYNNDGGQGHIWIDTRTGIYHIENEQNYTETNTFFHKGSVNND